MAGGPVQGWLGCPARGGRGVPGTGEDPTISDTPPKLRAEFSRDELAEDYAQAFFDYWCEARGTEPMPPVSAIDPMRLPRSCLPYLSVLEVEAGTQRLRSRLTGTAVVEQLGINMAGHYLDEFPSITGQIERLTWCVREQRPYLTEDDLTFAPNDFKRYQVLIVPFGDPGAGVQRVVGVFCFLGGVTSQRSWTT